MKKGLYEMQGEPDVQVRVPLQRRFGLPKNRQPVVASVNSLADRWWYTVVRGWTMVVRVRTNLVLPLTGLGSRTFWWPVVVTLFRPRIGRVVQGR